MKNKGSRTGILIGAAAVILIGIIVFFVLTLMDKKTVETAGTAISEETAASAGEEDGRFLMEKRITYEGKDYIYNSDIRNILFLGVDKTEDMQIQEYQGRGGQADAIILLSLNEKDKTATMLNISRDSMADIDIYGAKGDYLTTEKAQLALQYAYGDGEKKSCWLMKKAVTRFLGELPIHGYLAMNIDGISTINNVLGGVTLTIPEDYTFIDPAFIQGETVTLSGSQAERYVRYRDITELGSNNGRMVRQNQFLKVLVRLLKEKINGDSAFVDTLLKAGKAFMTTDLSVDQMTDMASHSLDEEFIKVPGETRDGDEHDEYHVDDEALKKLLIKMFYIEDRM